MPRTIAESIVVSFAPWRRIQSRHSTPSIAEKPKKRTPSTIMPFTVA